MTRVAVPALVALIVVATLLGYAGCNKSGEPRLLLTLTERELPRLSMVESTDEDRGRRLRIAVNARHDPLDSLNWLPESRLRALGFPFSVTAGAPEAADTYSKTPPRLGWVAFEFDGPAWRDIERRRALQPDTSSQPGLQSRLVPVDAGPDLDAMLAKYPTGHLILQAVIHVNFLPPDRGGPLVYGTLGRVIPSQLTVPSHVRQVLDEQAGDPAGRVAARYEVDVATGRFGVPYVRSLRPMQSPVTERRTKKF
jgi:hypothetical protein